MTQTMQAAVFDHYGDVDVLHIADIPRPTISAGQILVKVHAAAINPKDTFIRKGRFKRFTGNDFPKTTGFDFAGVVAESQVDDLPLGTPVFGMLDGWHGATCAEYVVVAGEQVAIKPDNVSFVDAAAIPLVGLTALQALRDEGGLRENANQSVCINGASGGVGTMAVQIAKRYGAKVTAIASERNHAFLRELGADHCIDYRQTDITQTNSQFDIFFDVFGNINYRNAKPILTPSGTWVSTVLKLHVFVSMMLSRFTRQSAKLVVVKANRADLQQLGEWLAIGAVRAIIHETYPLADIQSAHSQQQTKHTRGKLVVKMPE